MATDPYRYLDRMRERQAQPETADPFVADLARQRDDELAFRVKVAKPDEAARAQSIAQARGLPAAAVEANLSAFEKEAQASRARAAMQRHPAIGRWSASASNVAIAADDYSTLDRLGTAFMNRVALDKLDIVTDGGFLDRMGDLFKSGLYSLEQGASSFRGALQDWSARNPLPWTSRETIDRDRAGAASARARARIYGDVAATKVAGETDWSALKSRPTVGNILSFGLDQGVKSLPGMAQAALAVPLYVAGQAGNIGQTRAQVQGGEDATAQDVAEATPAAILSATLERIGIHGIFGAGARTAVGRIAQASATEASTEFAQSMVEYIGGHSQTGTKFNTDEMLDQAFSGMVAGGLMGGGLRTSGELARPAVRPIKAMVTRISDANRAINDGRFLDDIAAATAESKTAKRSPDAIADLVQKLGEDSGVEQVYLPAEAIMSYMQSDSYAGDLDAWRAQIDEADATGGDLVLPVGELTRLAATPGWEALKSELRLSAGGMSLREAEAFNQAWTDAMEELSDSVAQEAEQARAADVPREQLLQSITEKLAKAGFSPSMARQNAEFLTQRAVTRALRMGRDLTGAEYDALQVRQILPENIAAVQMADQIDVAIDVMKRRLDPAQNLGPSLMEFIAKGGGMVDTGGDLKAMGADSWHKGKPGKRRFIRDQGELIEDGGFGENEYGPDAWAQRAWEAGYFPEFGDQRPSANDLLDAVAEGVAGRDRTLIAREKSVRDAAEELRALLENRGIDPDKTSRSEIRKAIEDYAAQEAAGDGYMQGDLIPRGRILFPGGQSASAIIELYQTQNASTFLHESGHLWLEELREDAADPGAPQQVRDDWQIVQDWFAASGHPLDNGKIPVDAHELWARGVERYLMEGKAPSPGLQRLFQTFKAWMISLYNSVSRLDTPISDEVRGVMDRLIASDEELADAIAAQHLEALFPEKPASMTEAEYAAYRTLTATAREQAQSHMLAKTMNAVKRRVTKEWREREEDVRQDVTERIDALPEFRALRLARETPLDSQWIRDVLGDDATALLPKDFKRLHKENGANPDEVAELSGFRTGDEMVRALMGIEIRRREMREKGDKRSPRKAMIDQEVEALMLERFGDPFTDGSIEQEALAAVQSDELGAVMGAELRVLGRMTGQRVTPYSVAKSWAERQITDGRVRDVASRSAIIRYERAAAKAGRAAMDAVIAKDHDEAFRQKQSQMLNNALVAAARRGADQVDEAVKRLEKWAKRRTVKGVDQDYLERAQLLLEQIEMKQRTQRSLNRQESFEAWAAQRQAEGYDVVVPPSFAESIGRTHWTRLKVGQLLALNDAVMQIIHLGRHKQSLIDGQEEREFEAVVYEALTGMDGMMHRPPSDLMEPSRWDDIKSKVAAFDASLLKMEQVFDWLDGGRSDGVFNRVVFQPLADAQAREATMLEDYYARIRAEFGKVDAKQLRRWSERFVADELINRETGQPYKMKREQLIAIALNMGNEGNIQRLTDGYGWPEDSVRRVLDREMTAADWQFVQNIWDIIDTLWPDIAAMERRVNGVEPDKVEPRQVETPHGTYRGGYYPAIYDSSKSYAAEQHAGQGSDLLDAIYTRATTRASSTRERSEQVKRPILLQLGVINRHLGEVIHDITHREAVMQADKFLQAERIMKAVDDTMGPEIRKQFRPWLKYIANSWAMERAGNEGVGAFMQKLRSNTTVVGMGFRFTTMLTQLAGYSNSFEYVGAKWVSAGIAQTTAHPIETYNFVMEKSDEIRNRMDTLDRDIRLTLAEMQGRKQVITAAKRFAFHGIGYMDRMVVVPTWIGAYNKAQAAGMDEAGSIYAADKAVRLSQGAGAPKDLAAIARGTGKWGEALKLMTMFYSYMSAFYQRERTLGRDIMTARSGDVPALLARAWWLIVVPPVLSQILAGRGPEDEEDWGAWSFKQMLFQMLGPIPGLRDLAPPIWQAIAGDRPFDYQFTPMQRAFQVLIDTAGDVRKLWDGKEAKRPVRNALEAVGYWTGLVPGQAATSAQFLVDVGTGDQDPETLNQWYEGLTKGRIKED